MACSREQQTRALLQQCNKILEEVRYAKSEHHISRKQCLLHATLYHYLGAGISTVSGVMIGVSPLLSIPPSPFHYYALCIGSLVGAVISFYPGTLVREATQHYKAALAYQQLGTDVKRFIAKESHTVGAAKRLQLYNSRYIQIKKWAPYLPNN